jgi:hypothetical protein
MSEVETKVEDDQVQIDYLSIIESQINLISAVIEYPDEIYDRMAEDKVMVLANAFQIIIQTQNALIEAI